MPQIAFERVSKFYAQEAALRDVSVTFKERVTTAVVGPSGSGKSTLLQLINGLVRPSSGSIDVFGKPIDYERLPELRRQIGYAVQENGLFPHMTVEGNITLLARLSGWTPKRYDARARSLSSSLICPGLMQVAIHSSCRAASSSALAYAGP